MLLLFLNQFIREIMNKLEEQLEHLNYQVELHIAKRKGGAVGVAKGGMAAPAKKATTAAPAAPTAGAAAPAADAAAAPAAEEKKEAPAEKSE